MSRLGADDSRRGWSFKLLCTVILFFLATACSAQSFVSHSQYILERHIASYDSHIKIDYQLGTIEVSTLDNGRPSNQKLIHSIEALLTTPVDPELLDVGLSHEFGLTGSPFLLNLVRDHDGEVIKYKWRARRYAEYLVQHAMRVVKNSGNTMKSITFPMVSNLRQAKASQYVTIVDKAAKQFHLDKALILAIIDTESSFNPFAESPSKAYGLMQVMRKTAGRDVFQKIYDKNKTPSKRYLLNPKKNIQVGTAYLALLRDRYLKQINDRKTREYCMIAAYNGGAGLLYDSFDRNRQRAIKKINSMSPNEVYFYIIEHHKKRETRQYLKKVIQRKSYYVS